MIISKEANLGTRHVEVESAFCFQFVARLIKLNSAIIDFEVSQLSGARKFSDVTIFSINSVRLYLLGEQKKVDVSHFNNCIHETLHFGRSASI